MQIATIAQQTITNATQIQQTFFVAYQEEAILLQLDDFPPLRRTVADIQTSDSLFVGCWEAGQLIALAEIEIEVEQVNIAGFVVVPSMFRQGVGTRLLSYILAEYAAQPLTVSTAKDNLPAIGLYTKHGFTLATQWQTPDLIEMVTLRKDKLIMMKIDRLDHFVLTVSNIEATVQFYTEVLGMEKVEFGNGRIALIFGQQKINLHQRGHEFEPKAAHVQTGSADLCFITTTPIADVIEHLQIHQIEIIAGPVARTGATGKITSVYLRDPDKNLIELSNY